MWRPPQSLFVAIVCCALANSDKAGSRSVDASNVQSTYKCSERAHPLECGAAF
jgi:hypothetical protein